ncbi:MAG: 4Fe-4S binding protein [Chloroflexota bacterium]
MLEQTGTPTPEDIARVTPSPERRQRGPVAVVECFQKIPCNPCYTACKTGAYRPFADINDLPTIDHERCNGCGVCVSNCPGLAIFIVDESSPNEDIVRIPYEFLPLPQPGEIVDALSRAGEPLAAAKVVRVQNAPALDKTNVIWLSVPKGFGMSVRSMKVRR